MQLYNETSNSREPIVSETVSVWTVLDFGLVPVIIPSVVIVLLYVCNIYSVVVLLKALWLANYI